MAVVTSRHTNFALQSGGPLQLEKSSMAHLTGATGPSTMVIMSPMVIWLGGFASL